MSWRAFLGAVDLGALALVCLAVWLHAADGLLVATMLPAIVAGIGGAHLVGWSISLYEIGSIVAGAASALLTLRLGMRRPMSGAAALFALGCAISGLGVSFEMLLAGRLLQGLGGGGLVAMAFVMVGVAFERRHTARALAAVSTLWGVSSFIGPMVGGLFVEYATWRWGFGFFALQALALAAWILWRPEPPSKAAPEPPPTGAFPWRRILLLSLAVLAIAGAGVSVHWLRTPLLVVLGLAGLAAFLRVDARAGYSRLLPPRPFDPRQTAGAALLMILSLSVATIALTAFGPLLITAIHGVSALTAGYLIAASSIGWTVTAVVFSGAPERRDRAFIGLGIGVVVASVLGLTYAVPAGPVWLIGVFAALEGGGFGIAWTFILRRTTALAPPQEVSRIAGAIPTVQRLGFALGAAYIGIVANAAGLLQAGTPEAAARVALVVFVACLPFAAIALAALAGLLRTPVNTRAPA